VAEVNILRELKHPYIVRYYDRYIDKQTLKIYIIMEYCQGGDLQKMIRSYLKRQEYIPEEFIWRIFSQLVSALHMCHKRTDQTYINRGDQPHN
jgi:NIMA (never in mitosis gene a)-related kinase